MRANSADADLSEIEKLQSENAALKLRLQRAEELHRSVDLAATTAEQPGSKKKQNSHRTCRCQAPLEVIAEIIGCDDAQEIYSKITQAAMAVMHADGADLQMLSQSQGELANGGVFWL